MAFQELIKHFDKIRYYMHEFYIYGFKSRYYIDTKNQRSYDNEKRRLESYLQDYMSFQYVDSKLIFLSIDNRHLPHNPLYKAFQSKSFTDKMLTFHFILFDILYDEQIKLTFKEIIDQIHIYLSYFQEPIDFDESTIRKKLNEYVQLGIVKISQINHQNIYQRTASFDIKPYEDALLFFSEASLLGIPGYFLLNRIQHLNYFRFKHHYISYAIDSEIIYHLFCAMHQKREIIIDNLNTRTHKTNSYQVLPLKIYMSCQTGRMHLMAYTFSYQRMSTYRIDHIQKVKFLDVCTQYDIYRKQLNDYQAHIWSIQYIPNHIEHVEFIIYIQKHEQFIYQRLLREKRIGTINQIDQYHYQFQADVYDTNELVPWIRTFIGRICEINFTNRIIENRLKYDIENMYKMYEIGDD